MSEGFKRFAWITYDHLGGLVLLNLLWSGLSLPWLFGGGLLLGVGASLTGQIARPGMITALVLTVEMVVFAPPTGLLFLAGMQWAREEEVQVGVLLKGLRRFWWRAQLLALLLLASTMVGLVNVFFYQRLGGWLGMVLSGIVLWSLIAVLLTSLYLFPVLMTQDGRVWQTVYQSFLLVVDNLRISFVLLLASLAVLGIGMLTGIGLFCGLLAGLVLLNCIFFRQLLAKYGGAQLPPGLPRKWGGVFRET